MRRPGGRAALARRWVLGACLLPVAAAACAGRGAAREAAPSAAVRVSERLYFGRSIPGGGTVGEAEWTRFLAEVVTPRFPEGLTVWRAEGQWLQADGVVAGEGVFVLEVVHAPGAELERALEEIGLEYKRRFRQEAVMRVTTDVEQRFYEEE